MPPFSSSLCSLTNSHSFQLSCLLGLHDQGFSILAGSDLAGWIGFTPVQILQTPIGSLPLTGSASRRAMPLGSWMSRQSRVGPMNSKV